MRKTRIAILLASHGGGGLEKHFIDLCNGLVRSSQFEVIAIGHPEYKDRLLPQVALHAIDLDGARNNPRTLFTLARMLRRIRADIIHAQANKAALMLARIRRFVPGAKVATLHNTKNRVSMFQHYDQVVSVSRKAAAPLRQERVEVIYNGLDPAFELTSLTRAQLLHQLGLAPDKPLFVAVGRLVPAKAFEVLLDAWSRLDSQLIIVGDGPLRQPLTRQLEKNRLQNRVRLVGRRDDVPTLLALSDACLISSRNEGFPYVMVESLLVGTPMIATPVSGCDEILPKPALTGFSAKEMAERIGEWEHRLPQLRDLFEPTFAFAQRELTASAMIGHHIRVYRRLLEGPQQGVAGEPVRPG